MIPPRAMYADLRYCADPRYCGVAAWALLTDSGLFTLQPWNAILARSLPLPSLFLIFFYNGINQNLPRLGTKESHEANIKPKPIRAQLKTSLCCWLFFFLISLSRQTNLFYWFLGIRKASGWVLGCCNPLAKSECCLLA